MKEEVSQLIKGLQYMHPRFFSTYGVDPIDVLNEHMRLHLGDQEFHLWSREVMGGNEGIHKSLVYG